MADPSRPAPTSSAPFVFPPEIIVRHKSAGIARAFGWLGWIGFFGCVVLLLSLLASKADYYDTTDGVSQKFHSGDKFGRDKVAIISVEGVIMDGDGFVKKQIDSLRDDEQVKAVVVRVNSPGGTVTGSDYIYHHLKKLRDEKDIPVVVSMGSIAASGGYYVAMAVGDQPDSIYAEPTTTTGSIGVIVPRYDVTGLMKELNIEDDSIATHPNKQMLSMTKQLTDEQRGLVQSYVNESFERFKGIIREGRPIFAKDPEALDQLATGEVFTAGQAKKHGLVDRIGFVEDAIDRAIELAKLKKEKVRVVEFERPASAMDLLGLSAQVPIGRQSHLNSLMELNSPRPFFLATTMPCLFRTSKAYGAAD